MAGRLSKHARRAYPASRPQKLSRSTGPAMSFCLKSGTGGSASRSPRDAGRSDFMGSTGVSPSVPLDQDLPNAAERDGRKKAALFQRLTDHGGVQPRSLENDWRSG